MTSAQAHRLAAAYVLFAWHGDYVSASMLLNGLDRDELVDVTSALGCLAMNALADALGRDVIADTLANMVVKWAAEEAATPGA